MHEDRYVEPIVSVIYDDGGDSVTVSIADPDQPMGMPAVDFTMDWQQIRVVERELKIARLADLGIEEVTCRAEEVQQYDVIACLGFTVSDVLIQAGAQQVVLQDNTAAEIQIELGREVVVHRKTELHS
jgi:hypothetical protein